MLVKEEMNIYFAVELAWGRSLSLCKCTRSFARANDAKIVRSRDAECNIEKSP